MVVAFIYIYLGAGPGMSTYGSCIYVYIYLGAGPEMSTFVSCNMYMYIAPIITQPISLVTFVKGGGSIFECGGGNSSFCTFFTDET